MCRKYRKPSASRIVKWKTIMYIIIITGNIKQRAGEYVRDRVNVNAVIMHQTRSDCARQQFTDTKRACTLYLSHSLSLSLSHHCAVRGQVYRRVETGIRRRERAHPRSLALSKRPRSLCNLREHSLALCLPATCASSLSLSLSLQPARALSLQPARALSRYITLCNLR